MCNIKTINSVTNTDLGEHSHMILHHFVEEDNYKCYKLKFASKYVENEVFKTIDAYQRSDLMTFLRTSKGNPLFSVHRGQLFEGKAHQLIAAGGKFTQEVTLLPLPTKSFALPLTNVGSTWNTRL